MFGLGPKLRIEYFQIGLVTVLLISFTFSSRAIFKNLNYYQKRKERLKFSNIFLPNIFQLFKVLSAWFTASKSELDIFYEYLCIFVASRADKWIRFLKDLGF